MAVPRYFFDVHDRALVRDQDGIELPDLNAAIREAIRGLPEIARDTMPRGDDRQNFSIVVRDQNGRPIYTAALSFCGTRL